MTVSRRLRGQGMVLTTIPLLSETCSVPWCFLNVGGKTVLRKLELDLSDVAKCLGWTLCVLDPTESNVWDLQRALYDSKEPESEYLIKIPEGSLQYFIDKHVTGNRNHLCYAVFPCSAYSIDLRRTELLVERFFANRSDIVVDLRVPAGSVPVLLSRTTMLRLADIGASVDVFNAIHSTLPNLIEAQGGRFLSGLSVDRVFPTDGDVFRAPQREIVDSPLWVGASSRQVSDDKTGTMSAVSGAMGRAYSSRTSSNNESASTRRLRPSVCYVTPASVLSGAELSMLELVGSMSEVCDVRVLLGSDGYLARRLEKLKIKHYVVHESLTEPTENGIQELCSVLTSERVKIVHIEYLSCLTAVLAARSMGLRVIQHARIIPRVLPSEWHLVDAVICVSSSVAAMTRALGCRAPLVCRIFPGIGVPIDCSTSFVASSEPESLVAGARKRTRLLVIGRVCPQKGQHFAIDLLARLKARVPEATVQLVGEVLPQFRSYYQSLVSMARKLGVLESLQFLGFTENVWGLFAEDCILVHVGINEAFGRSIVEGMMGGIPVVAFSDWGPDEILGESVSLVPWGNMNELVEVVSWMMEREEKVRELIQDNKLRAARFSLRRQRKEIISVYRDLLNSRECVMSS